MAKIEIIIPNVSGSGGVSIHNDLTGIQGGTENERIHLTEAQLENSQAAYNHSQIIEGNPHNVTAEDLGITGINTGDETTNSIQTKRPLKTIVNKSIEGVGNVLLNTGDVTEVADKKYVTDSEKTKLLNTSGINTGDQNLSLYAPLNNPTFTGAVVVPNGVNPNQAVNLGQLDAKQTKPIIISANKTAVNDEIYHNIGNNTYTDPTGVTGKGYYFLNVSGSPTVGGNAQSVGTYLFRYYNGTVWVTNIIKKGVSNAVYSANKTLGSIDNNDTIFMDSGTLTVNPSTQTYQDGYTVAVKSSGASNTPLVFTAHTGWTYVINGATAVASASVNLEKGRTCTIIRKANLNIFEIDGGII